MGAVFGGAPTPHVLRLAALSGAQTFVETGTFTGQTTRWAADHFARVHTVERSQELFDLYSPDLSAIANVTPHLGDSRTVLPEIIEGLDATPAIHWLDGHWSGGPTAGEDDECPILDELECLASRQQDVILIDDARLFLAAPPEPHDPAQWPTLLDISRVLINTRDDRPYLQVIDDVVFIVPPTDALVEGLIEIARKSDPEPEPSVGILQRLGLSRTRS